VIQEAHVETIGILGATGPLGRGLAARWTRAGYEVHLGSRRQERADEARDGLVERGAPQDLLIAGENLAVAEAADVVVVAVPYEGQAPALPSLADAVDGKVVCTAVVPLGFDANGPHLLDVEDGSAAHECQRLLPGARLVAGFHAVSSKRLRAVDEPVEADAMLCSDDEEAMALVAGLADAIDGLRGVPVGPLRLASQLEGQTAVVLSYNKRNRTEAGLRLISES
jgi:8-hydroxy-5-deazaflavin:NADPH oxidoreductase